ncbi:hypothetical protein LMG19083_04931 [Ralstonia psammae]|uniref:HTH cro/C1-type domain-containing protein n=1 Tax=Ralstonia psammae TaxID=3058598 RepID=A0ABM9JZK8_9RALS|nr:helix-turn-helix transcriptional regulator [Ralstonia sp. LMG 19083]CAJ0809429.1 hypothetical protein LMG19083_04931 [Ralstonia sp. LMG 19083]
MHQSSAPDWQLTFDEVKRRGRFNNDAQVAESLGVTRAQISAWRTGKSDLGTLIKLKLLDALGVENLHSVLHSLYPVRNREDHIRRQARLVDRVRHAGDQPARELANPANSEPAGALSWEDNVLLAGLPEDERAVFSPHISAIFLPLGAVAEGAESAHDIYFPTTAVVSLSLPAMAGIAEWAIVGREECVGSGVLPSDVLLPRQTVVLHEGHAFRLSGRVFQAALARSAILRQRYFRCLQSIAGQFSQAAFCNTAHSSLQRFCRWLLVADRSVWTKPISAHPTVMANHLGMTVQEVTDAIALLHAEGAICWESGAIRLLERSLVALQACECSAMRFGRYPQT